MRKRGEDCVQKKRTCETDRRKSVRETGRQMDRQRDRLTGRATDRLTEGDGEADRLTGCGVVDGQAKLGC